MLIEAISLRLMLRPEKEKFIDISTTDYINKKKGLRLPIQARVEYEALLEEDLSPKRAFLRPPERTDQSGEGTVSPTHPALEP